MKTNIILMLAVAAILASCAIEISVWRECQRDHSFLYCLRVLS
jgi:hypothetical protein